MAQPSVKHYKMEQSLTEIFGYDRRDHIRQNVCVPAPIGCGGPATEFKDGLSRKEYTISGLCQNCQDIVFNSEEE